MLEEYGKSYIILGNLNAVSYKEVFPLFKEGELWLGHSIRSGDRKFEVPNSYPLESASWREVDGKRFIRVKAVRWFTNLEHGVTVPSLELSKEFSKDYQTYVNYPAIEVSKVSDIPVDYSGKMGVPISFIDWYNPEQFELVGASQSLATPMSEVAGKGSYQEGGRRFYLRNAEGYRRVFERLVIRHI